MDTIGKRLKYARKSKGFTMESLADAIGVSRGVIDNIELNKTKNEPQRIVINEICRVLDIRKDWLLTGDGEMQDKSDISKSAVILAELYDTAKNFSEAEQLYLLDMTKSLKARLCCDKDK